MTADFSSLDLATRCARAKLAVLLAIRGVARDRARCFSKQTRAFVKARVLLFVLFLLPHRSSSAPGLSHVTLLCEPMQEPARRTT